MQGRISFYCNSLLNISDKRNDQYSILAYRQAEITVNVGYGTGFTFEIHHIGSDDGLALNVCHTTGHSPLLPVLTDSLRIARSFFIHRDIIVCKFIIKACSFKSFIQNIRNRLTGSLDLQFLIQIHIMLAVNKQIICLILNL